MHGFTVTARLLSQVIRLLTGVEIHPAADIGRRVFIDHGAAVVVGETADIGDDVLLDHGVTLGGDPMRRGKRHPLCGGVPVGANATLIGDVTVGDGATVGAGSVVVDRSRPTRPSPARPPNPSTEPAPIGSSRASAARSESGRRPERVQRRRVAWGVPGLGRQRRHGPTDHNR